MYILTEYRDIFDPKTVVVTTKINEIKNYSAKKCSKRTKRSTSHFRLKADIATPHSF